MSKMTKAKKKRAADEREALIGKAIDAMKRHGAMACADIGAAIGEPNGRRLSAALRVARKDGRVTFDGKRYAVAAPKAAPTVPAWVREGQPVVEISAPHRVGRLMPFETGWRVVNAEGQNMTYHATAEGLARAWTAFTPSATAPGSARDLAERQAFDPRPARAAYLRRILTAAGAKEATDSTAGLLVSHTDDGRVSLRWGMKRDGGAVACSLTEEADAQMERAAHTLEGAGFKVMLGEQGFRAPGVTLQSVDGDERAGVPTEAAERVAELERRLAEAEKERDEARARVAQQSRAIAGLLAGLNEIGLSAREAAEREKARAA